MRAGVAERWDRPRRLVPELGFPPYRHLPGSSPHPRERELAIDLPEWSRSRRFLYGVDLFQRRYYWEAHEAWEGIWLRLAPGAREREFLQGLIQGAGALLKVRVGLVVGAARLWERGRRRLVEVARGGDPYRGISVMGVVRRIDPCVAGGRLPAGGGPLIPFAPAAERSGDGR